MAGAIEDIPPLFIVTDVLLAHHYFVSNFLPWADPVRTVRGDIFLLEQLCGQT